MRLGDDIVKHKPSCTIGPSLRDVTDALKKDVLGVNALLKDLHQYSRTNVRLTYVLWCLRPEEYAHAEQRYIAAVLTFLYARKCDVRNATYQTPSVISRQPACFMVLNAHGMSTSTQSTHPLPCPVEFRWCLLDWIRTTFLHFVYGFCCRTIKHIN